MSCAGVTAALTVNVSSADSFSQPTIKQGTCGPVTNPDPALITGTQLSAWVWSGTIQGVPDGIVKLSLKNAPANAGKATTGATDHLLIRKDKADNVMVYARTADYDNSAFTLSGGKYVFTHKALGADMFRYTWNYGYNWSDWAAWESARNIDSSKFVSSDIYNGQHVIVQCESLTHSFLSFD